MGYNNIIYEKDERLAFITLNRPEKLNPLSHALRGEVYDALRDAEADTEIGVIILKGAGRAFQPATTSLQIPMRRATMSVVDRECLIPDQRTRNITTGRVMQ